MTNLVAEVERAVRDRPGATAISVAGNDTTYAEFWALTGRFAGALEERGFEPGTAVALYLPNLPQFVVAFYGVLRTGGTVVALDPAAEASEIRDPLADSDAIAAVTTLDRVPEVEAVHDDTRLRYVVTADGSGRYSTGFSEFLAEGADTLDYWEVVERDEEDLAVLASTAGTTGEPKGVQLTHRNVTSASDAASQLLPGGLSAEDAVLGALPFWHAYGMTTAMTASLASGATLHPLPDWDAGETLSMLDDGITVFHGLPSMYEDLLGRAGDEDHDLSSVELAGVLGGGGSGKTLQAFESEFGVPVHEGYGLTEAAGLTHANAPSWGRREGSVGKPVPGVFARVVDDGFEDLPPVEEGPVEHLDDVSGEIVVSGPSVTPGYRDASGAPDDAVTEYDGRRWFHTGDVGYRDEDDFYYVLGRKGDAADAEGTDRVDEDDEIEGDADPGEGADAETGQGDAEPGQGDDDEPGEGDDETGESDETESSSDGAAEDEVDDLEPAPDAASVEAGSSPEADDDGEDEEDAAGLKDLKGISESRAATLRDAGFESVGDLREADREALTDVKGFGDALVARIKGQIDDD